MEQDRSYVQSNWEGNESFLRFGMVARAGRNKVLWAKIGFQHTLPGNHINKKEVGDTIPPTRHDKTGEAAIIHEDMSAGLAIRTVPVSFWLKLGAVHWVEASPLTIWKAQPRMFAWEYLPYEIEQPIARYYEYNIAKGERIGRAAWNKKAFQGINLESINLPGNLYFNSYIVPMSDMIISSVNMSILQMTLHWQMLTVLLRVKESETPTGIFSIAVWQRLKLLEG